MKIEYLEIKNYKQFTDLTLDLTYPKGHEKEGKPLDKICIIGQSGTGKTNLLEIIRDKKNDDAIKTVFIKNKSLNSKKIYFVSAEKKCNNIKQNDIEENQKAINRLLKEKESLIAGEAYGHVPFDYKILDIAIDAIRRKYNYKIFVNHEEIDSVVNVDNEISWKILKEKINNYDVEKNKYTRRLSNKLIHNSKYSKEDFILDIKKWEKENENILEKIANDINSIIKKFNLELKIDEDTNSYEELILKDLSNGNIINYDDISTGTKNLLSTFIPLKSYNPKDSIILIDEPENSFYPDIQRELTDLYMNVGENNQLIMATHSPLIASSFEPWEIVELKFDKNNQIYREKYYEGEEDHVNNYTRDPRMLTWTGILTDIFDLEEDSNFIFREKKLMEYAMLKNKIKTISDTEEKEKLFKELRKIGKQLGLYNQ